jgi:hypothetical protein
MPKIPLKVLFSFFAFLCLVSASGQSATQILEAGHNYYHKGDYLGASKVYKQAMMVDSSDAAVLYHYSKSLMQLMQMEDAARYLFKASLIDRGVNYPDVYYLLAEAYRGSGDYRKARRYYTKALIPYRRNRKSYWYKRIDQSKEANSWAMQNSLSRTTEMTPIDPQFNSASSEFSPKIIDGKLYFTSLRADSTLENDIVLDQQYFSQLYYANLNEKGSAEKLLIADKKELLKNLHIANISLSEDADKAYFSVCDTNYKCQIWSGQIDSNQIVNIKKLNKNINYPNANNTQAEIIERNGKNYLIFSSDRPKGFGGMDLWIAEEMSFGFDQAINLGADINTLGNEISPYYQDGWLYFSSDWHLGYGGYDNFKIQGWKGYFQEAINLGEPLNSPADDYYFSLSNGQALIASNRKQKNSPDFCCNDIYYTPYEEDEAEEIKADTLVPDIVTLNKYLPLDLYFHNDYPDPGSRDSSTDANYMKLAQEYLQLKSEYKKELAKTNLYVKDEQMAARLETFFEEDIVDGVSDLEFFTPLLLRALEAGKQVELSIKGFASSLSGAEYNLNLTLRRIYSLVNYFSAYENGVFLPYLNGTAANGGSLSIVKLPFGEFAIKDRSIEDDKTLAVYSPQAAMQRKIELIAVSQQDGVKKRFDSKEDYKPAKIEFNSRSYELGEIENEELERIFLMKNSGGEKLKIYNIMVNCDDCAQVEFPEELEPNESGRIELRLDTKSMKGEVTVKLTVVSNSVPHLNELSISFIK